jgi:hypothetical protein
VSEAIPSAFCRARLDKDQEITISSKAFPDLAYLFAKNWEEPVPGSDAIARGESTQQ